MAPLSQEQVAALQADMSVLLEKHGMTSGYLVAECRNPDGQTSNHCVVAISAVPPVMPNHFIEELASQTYQVVASLSKMAVSVNDN